MAGIIRKLDNLGRPVIPKEFRKQLGFNAGTHIEIINTGTEIIIRKAREICTICGKAPDIEYRINNKIICKKCKQKIQGI